MEKRMIKFVVGIILVSTIVAFAGAEERAHIEAEKHALMLKAQEFELHIQQLRVQALEHEAQAKALQAEAARVELEMRREIETHKTRIEMAAAEVEVQQMFAESRHLREKGHHEEAHKLDAQADHRAAELKQRMRAHEERELGLESQKIGHLREKAEAAKREGRREEAHHLWAEAEAMEKRLGHALEQREKQMHVEEMELKIHHMFNEAEELKRRGHGEEAHKLHAQAEAPDVGRKCLLHPDHGDRLPHAVWSSPAYSAAWPQCTGLGCFRWLGLDGNPAHRHRRRQRYRRHLR